MGKELIQIIEIFSNEKGVQKQDVIEALEISIAAATKKNFDNQVDIKVKIDDNTGEYATFRQWQVVADDDPEFTSSNFQLLLSQAQSTKPDIKVGDFIQEEIESVSFGRIGAQNARQVLNQKIREKEREIVVETYTPRIGELMPVTIKRIEKNNFILDFGDSLEGVINRADTLAGDDYKIGDRFKAVLKEVSEQTRGPQLTFTRTTPQMLKELMKIEIPEIYDDLIEIVSIARDPGFRAKVAVKSNDKRLDPAGACIGMRGSRIIAITNELSNERIDIVVWDENPAKYVINAMSPAKISHITLDEDNKTMDIGVEEEMLPIAIGKNGQNVQLASTLTGWELNVMPLEEVLEKQKQEKGKLTTYLQEKLEIDAKTAKTLVDNSMSSIKDIANLDANELLALGGLDQIAVENIQTKARQSILMEMLETEDTPSEDLINLAGMTEQIVQALANKKIISQEDLAELSIDELQELIEIDKEAAGKLIMEAREPWFKE